MKVKRITITNASAPNKSAAPYIQLTLTPDEVKIMRFCLSTACQLASQSGGSAADEIRQLATDFRPALNGILWDK